MGTSGAYGGSVGSDFGRARRKVNDFISDPSAESAKPALQQLVDALGWQGDDADGGAGSDAGATDAQPAVDPNRRNPMRPAAPRSGGGGGAAGGGGGGGRRSGGGGGGGGRSRARAAGVGGRAAAAGYALRSADAATLAGLGLDLGELAGLDAFEQTSRIVDALVESSGSIEDDELRRATAAALLELLEYDGDADGETAVRLFITEYVFEIAITEFGDKLRDGSRPGEQTVVDEDVLKDTIRANVDQMEFGLGEVTPDAFEAAIRDGLGDVRDVFGDGE